MNRGTATAIAINIIANWFAANKNFFPRNSKNAKAKAASDDNNKLRTMTAAVTNSELKR